MGTISSSIGLVSGIDTQSIISQLVQLERQPIQTLQSRIAQTSSIQVALTTVSTRLNALKGNGTDLRKPSTFEAVRATSANEAALGVTAKVGAPAGRYNVEVRSLVQSQQSISSGFASKTSEVPAGTMTFEVGGGQLQSETKLADLNGFDGVAAGSFRITDAAGRSGVVETTGMLTLEEVAEAINLSDSFDVEAVIEEDQLVLLDQSGGSESLRVRDLSGGTTATDLRLTVDEAATVTATKINGGDLVYLKEDSLLAQLNEGRGVPTDVNSVIEVKDRHNGTYQVDLSGARTVGDVIERFNTATGGEVTLSLETDRSWFLVNDNTGKNGFLEISSLNGNGVAEALGIDFNDRADAFAGEFTQAKLGQVMTDSLNGGQGLDGGDIRITDRLGNTATIDASSEHLNRVLDEINDSGIGVEARINDAGNGIVLLDTTNGTGDLVVSDLTGNAAANLNLAGTHSASEVDSGNLQFAWITRSTSLDGYDVGRDVGDGTITFTDGNGGEAELDLSLGTYDTLGDVIDAINALGIDVNARINDNGDGLLVEDTSGGANPLVIADTLGGSAVRLGIEGSFDTGVADGSFERAVEVEAGDTLEDVQDKINELGFGVRANLVDDGSGVEPWRLSLTSRQGGAAGAFNFDGGTTGITSTTIARARDASVFIGGGNGLPPLAITGTSNTIENVLPGVTLDLRGTSRGEPIEVTVAQDDESLFESLRETVKSFNAIRDEIDDNSGFNSETNRRGALLGDTSISKVERDLYALLNETYDTGNSRYRILSDVGLRIGEGAKLDFDEDRFREAYLDDPDAVKEMFTKLDTDSESSRNGFGHRLQDVVSKLTDPVDGVMTRASDLLDEKNSAFEEQIALIEERVLVKEQQLQKQFLDMELALSELNFQQQQLSSIPSFSSFSSNGNSNDS
jgi:flagellar hook-associated protein 2